MDPRLTTLPDPVLEERLNGLIDPWCGQVRDVCRCAPSPLPEPKRPAPRLQLQRGMRAESSCEALDDSGEPLTHGTPQRASWPSLSPMTPLSPSYYRKAGAA